jgi:transposase
LVRRRADIVGRRPPYVAPDPLTKNQHESLTGWWWITGLGFDQQIPHHSTFSKNRHGRFQESKLFEQLFEQIVRQCVEVGLVEGKHLSVDGSFVEADAALISEFSD